MVYFNPRSDERSDVKSCKGRFARTISIHAPANGATAVIRSVLIRLIYFNPRSGERSDSILSAEILQQMYFNPRSGERSDI